MPNCFIPLLFAHLIKQALSNQHHMMPQSEYASQNHKKYPYNKLSLKIYFNLHYTDFKMQIKFLDSNRLCSPFFISMIIYKSKKCKNKKP